MFDRHTHKRYLYNYLSYQVHQLFNFMSTINNNCLFISIAILSAFNPIIFLNFNTSCYFCTKLIVSIIRKQHFFL